MAAGWLIGVLVETPDEPLPLRRYYAVAKDDRAQAEWTAVDQAMKVGRVASSPVGGVEPVQAEGELPARLLAAQGVKPGAVRDLGFRTPRRWLSALRPVRAGG
ncbi:hypothetical protein [Phenylobacterium sp.]|jgi:hypothetical protein|uniref:hypothetical protein n=1 Tax=Phenylobacterium sp. TaxID=1871053 RepID=UPI002F41CC4C